MAQASHLPHQPPRTRARPLGLARKRLSSTTALGALQLALLLGLSGCDDNAPALSKSTQLEDSEEMPTPDLGGAQGELYLGALLQRTPVYAAASKKAPTLGYLQAGSKVHRSKESYENEHCIAGWYQVAPEGYVCTEKASTVDMDHPTLIAMSLRPNLTGNLPYVYARTTKVTALLGNNGRKGVEMKGRVGKNTVMAIVGSWTAPDESREPVRLGLKLDGKFVRATDLEAASGSEFVGLEVSKESLLPAAFIVRRGVRAWAVEGKNATKGEVLDRHTRLRLTGRFRTIEDQKFWATEEGFWVRHKDVTVVRKRHTFPEFVTDDQKWVDVSIVTGSLVAYEGQTPVYASLVSVGRDRKGDPETTASTARGEFRVVSKHVTRHESDSDDVALQDAPWGLKLESGQWLITSPRHNRFGVEHTDGDIEVSPGDGAWLWRWAAPAVPDGWHSIEVDPAAMTTVVNVR